METAPAEPEQRDAAGCDLASGDVFGEPVPTETIEDPEAPTG